MKSNTIFYILVFLLGYLANVLVTSLNKEEIHHSNYHPEKQVSPPYKHLTKQSDAEQTKNPSIGKQKQDAPYNPSNSHQSLPVSSDFLKELTELREYKAKNEIEKHQNHLKEIGAINNLNQALADRFVKEYVDPTWSVESKTSLDNYINQKNHLNTLPNLSTECRSQQCKISILSTDPHHLSSIDDSLNQLISENRAFSNYTTVVDEKTNTTSIYIEKEPHNI